MSNGIDFAINIGLAGQPNTGKSSLFNRLTGAKQHVGNWPGKTVEKKAGTFRHGGKTYQVIDLPGTYSLTANSTEEIISRDYIVSNDVNMIIVMIDTSQLTRSLYLLSEIIGINVPVIAAFNMMDIAKGKGRTVDIEKIQKKLDIPVVSMVAAKGEGVEELLSKVEASAIQPKIPSAKKIKECYQDEYGRDYGKILDLLKPYSFGKCANEWIAAKLLENDQEVYGEAQIKLSVKEYQELKDILNANDNGQQKAANARFAFINDLLSDTVTMDKKAGKVGRSWFDRMSIHRVWGKVIAVVAILLAFIGAFIFTIPFMILMSGVAPSLCISIGPAMIGAGISPWLASLVAEALLPSIFMALYMGAFVCGVAITMGILEDIGYMARVAYVFDGLMKKIGLQGKAAMPFIASLGCNMAGVTGTRVMDSWKQRVLAVATSFVLPCLAVWGVVTLVGSFFFGFNMIWVVLALVAVSILHMKLTSWFFKTKVLKDHDYNGLIMELPPYHKPNWKTIFTGVWVKVKNVVTKAFSVIILVSVAIWILSYTKDGNIENSVIYAVGKFVEPFSMLFGLDWRLFIAFIISAMGKEAALGVMAILFGAGSGLTSFGAGMISGGIQYSDASIASAMGASVTVPMALAFIFAFYFNVPCMATIAVTNSELHSRKHTWGIALYYLATALIIGGIAYYVGLLLF